MEFLRALFLHFKTNLFIELCIIISLINLIRSIEFRYPTALTLENKQIFVVHSLGIDIYHSSYSISTKIIEFIQELSKSDLNKISISKYSSGEIIVLIIDTIYIFDMNGQKLISYTLTGTFNADYFSLTAHKIIKEDNNTIFNILTPLPY